MKAMILLWAWFACLPAIAQAIDFSHYHSQEEINGYLHQVARERPDLVHFHKLGYSEQGREINYVVIAKGDAEQLPAIYLNGTHHGNEKSSTETVIGIIDYLLSHSKDPEIAHILESYALYLQPLINPDGHALNSRNDARGRDPNRDYAFPERSDEESFKISAVKLVKELSDKVHFRAAAAFHSGMEGVLWPWCYSSQKNAEQDTFYTLSKIAAEAMGMKRYAQSYRDYPTKGEFIDYLYMTHGTLALTIEVSNESTPAAQRLAGYVQRGVIGGLSFVHAVMQLDEGTLEIKRAPEQKPLLGPTLVSSVRPTPSSASAMRRGE